MHDMAAFQVAASFAPSFPAHPEALRHIPATDFCLPAHALSFVWRRDLVANMIGHWFVDFIGNVLPRLLPSYRGHLSCFETRMRVPLLFLCLAIITTAEARIGETPIQFADRYGRPKDTSSTAIVDKSSPLVEKAVHHTYEYHGWRIRAAFLELDGPAVRMDFQKTSAATTGVVIRDDELQAIATANTLAGMTWKHIMYNNPDSPSKGIGELFEGFVMGAAGQKMWQRSDGAILSLRSNLIVRLELPTARQHEEALKIAKEQKARASVPTF